MHELPLFPLNTVLFPGMPLPLHIFEERYQEMIGLCLRERRPFGAVLIREGVPEFGPLPEPYAVGCTAAITQVQKLDEGRLFILSIGQDRFRIHALKRDRPYLVGLVEILPLLSNPTRRMAQLARALHPLVLKYLEILSRVTEVGFDPDQLPQEPETLGYLAASFIQVALEKKQHLLETDDLAQLLQDLHTVYSYELSLMRTMPAADQGLFSVN